jgi:hypothetical protein
MGPFRVAPDQGEAPKVNWAETFGTAVGAAVGAAVVAIGTDVGTHAAWWSVRFYVYLRKMRERREELDAQAEEEE